MRSRSGLEARSRGELWGLPLYRERMPDARRRPVGPYSVRQSPLRRVVLPSPSVLSESCSVSLTGRYVYVSEAARRDDYQTSHMPCLR